MNSKILKLAQETPPPSDKVLATIRYCVACLALTVILWANASDFDATEGKSIMLMMAILGGTEALGPVLKSIMQGRGTNGSSSD